MNDTAEALEILESARASLVERVCRGISECRHAFVDCDVIGETPFSTDRELARAAGALVRVNAVISALEQADHRTGAIRCVDGPAQRLSDAFARYVDLVRDDRLEEASHLLSSLLSMPLDRMVTATRFFKRARSANPQVVDGLWRLLDTVQDASSAQMMDLLVKTFGFQAVESGMAISSLREAAANGSPIVSNRDGNHSIAAAGMRV